MRNMPYGRGARVAVVLAILMSVFGTSPALAARDRKPPTKPANLRVTSLTPHRVTLAWDPSTDNSGTFTYRVFVSWGSTTTLPQTQTTYSVSLVPANTYSFYVYAVDGSGNVSQRSNTLTVTTPPDTTPPSAPVVSLVGVNPTEVSLRWTASTDDGLHIRYQVFVNGSPSGVETLNGLAAVVNGLTPETTYEIYLNGVLDHTTSGDRAVVDVTQTGDNTITLIAVDDAGNRSEPSTVTFFVQ